MAQPEPTINETIVLQDGHFYKRSELLQPILDQDEAIAQCFEGSTVRFFPIPIPAIADNVRQIFLGELADGNPFFIVEYTGFVFPSAWLQKYDEDETKFALALNNANSDPDSRPTTGSFRPNKAIIWEPQDNTRIFKLFKTVGDYTRITTGLRIFEPPQIFTINKDHHEGSPCIPRLANVYKANGKICTGPTFGQWPDNVDRIAENWILALRQSIQDLQRSPANNDLRGSLSSEISFLSWDKEGNSLPSNPDAYNNSGIFSSCTGDLQIRFAKWLKKSNL